MMGALTLFGVFAGMGGLLPAQSPPTAKARILAVTGTLSLQRQRMPVRTLKIHDAIEPGDELTTGPNAEATIRSGDGSTVHIYPDSRIVFNEQSLDIREFLHLFFGSVKVHIEKLTGRPNPQKLTTPTAIIAVRGTTFSVFVDDTDATLVAVDEGIVSVANVRSPQDEVLLRDRQRTWVRPGQPPTQAQRFRGPSERADLMPVRGGNSMPGPGHDACRKRRRNGFDVRPNRHARNDRNGRRQRPS